MRPGQLQVTDKNNLYIYIENTVITERNSSNFITQIAVPFVNTIPFSSVT